MGKLVGDKPDAERMDFMQGEIEKAILPYRENTEAIIVVGALLRVARMLLRLYKPDLRQGFVSAAIAYLQGKQEFGSGSGPNSRSRLEQLGFYLPPESKN